MSADRSHGDARRCDRFGDTPLWSALASSGEDLQIWTAPARLRDELRPEHLRHDDVREQQIDIGMAFEQVEGRRTAVGDDHLVAGVLEHALDEPPDAVLVLDDQHGLAAARRTLELDPLVLRRSARDIRLPVTADESLVAADAG